MCALLIFELYTFYTYLLYWDLHCSVPSLMNRLNSKIVKVDQEEQGGNHTSESAASHTSRFDHCDTR